MDDPRDKQFQPLRKLLELKRYERPPTEFRSEFMAEFRHRRQEVDRARTGWLWRLWTWAVPDWTGATLNAALVAIAVLLVANAVVMLRHQRSPRLQPVAVASARPVAMSPSPAVQPASLPHITNDAEEDELDYVQAYLMLSDFLGEAASVFDEEASHNVVLSPPPATVTEEVTTAPEEGKTPAAPMLPAGYGFPATSLDGPAEMF